MGDHEERNGEEKPPREPFFNWLSVAFFLFFVVLEGGFLLAMYNNPINLLAGGPWAATATQQAILAEGPRGRDVVGEVTPLALGKQPWTPPTATPTALPPTATPEPTATPFVPNQAMEDLVGSEMQPINPVRAAASLLGLVVAVGVFFFVVRLLFGPHEDDDPGGTGHPFDK